MYCCFSQNWPVERADLDCSRQASHMLYDAGPSMHRCMVFGISNSYSCAQVSKISSVPAFALSSPQSSAWHEQDVRPLESHLILLMQYIETCKFHSNSAGADHTPAASSDVCRGPPGKSQGASGMDYEALAHIAGTWFREMLWNAASTSADMINRPYTTETPYQSSKTYQSSTLSTLSGLKVYGQGASSNTINRPHRAGMPSQSSKHALQRSVHGSSVERTEVGHDRTCLRPGIIVHTCCACPDISIENRSYIQRLMWQIQSNHICSCTSC